MNTRVTRPLTVMAAVLMLAPVNALADSSNDVDDARARTLQRASDEAAEAARDAVRSIERDNRIELDVRLVDLSASTVNEDGVVTLASN